MRINNIGYLIKEGIRGIFLHGFMSFAAVCVTVACLLIVGSFSLLTINVNRMIKDMNRTNEIVVILDETLSDAQARSMTTPIGSIPNVDEAVFVSREQALKEFLEKYDEDPAFAGLDPQDLRHRVEVTLINNELMEETVQQISGIQGVAEIKASFELAQGFITMQNVLRVASFAIIIVLLIVSLLIISNTVKLGMYERRVEISIMKMVGATNGFIRLPYVVEGFTLGMLGAGIAFGLEWLLYDWLIQQLEVEDTLKLFSFVPFEMLMVPMLVIFAAAGLFVGVVGSWTSIRKFMDV